jgi:type II secretory pathway pseudopilin PulG
MTLIRSLPTMRRRRSAFTLVELLVATALTMLIMAIIASAFQTAMDSLSHLRSAGELQDRLRSAGERLRQDLQAPHFEDEAIRAGRLSEVRLDSNQYFRPSSGFFQITQLSESIPEHTGVQNSPRDYSTKSVDHALMFTMKLPGNSKQTIFSSPRVGAPAGQQGLDNKHDNLLQSTSQYGTRWAIVSYFLFASGQKTTGANPSNNKLLYNLHRKVKLLAEVPDSYIVVSSADAANYFFDPATGRVYTAADVASSPLIRPSNVDMFTPAVDGSDIVMSNLLSFEVKADYSPVLTTSASSVTTVFPRPSIRTTDLMSPVTTGVDYNANNKDFPFDDLPIFNTRAQTAKRSFDSGYGGGIDPSLSGSSVPQPYRVKAMQIKLRIYDPKNKATRQQTIVQEM